MTTLLADLRHALRVLRQTPTLTAIAVVSLALGVGANTAVFSVVHAVLLRPLPFPHPERIVTLEERDSDGTPAGTTGWATYVDWRARTRSFEEVAVAGYADYKLGSSTGREAEKIEGMRVSSAFFRVLGVKPMLGRDILPSDDVKGAPRVAILSHGLWKRRFAADPSVVGRTVRISDLPFTVVGVLPADFEAVFAPEPQKATELWSALRYDATLPNACRTCRHLRAFARLKPGVTIEVAHAEMETLSRALLAEHPADYPVAGAFVIPFSSRLTEPSRPILWTLLGAVAFVLLIACANVASLILGQASARRREIAIRSALGANRTRIVRMLWTESLILAVVGGGLGVAVASWLLPALLAAAPVQLPRAGEVRIDTAVLFFALGATLATSLLFGLAPALRMSREDPQSGLRDGAGSGRARSLASMGLLVSFDAAVAFLLLFGAALLMRSTAKLLLVDPGFSTTRTAKLEIDLSGPRYGENREVAAYYERVLERVRAVPGVQTAGISSMLPLGGNWDSYGIRVEGHEPAKPTDEPDALRYGVSPGYFETMKIPVLRGRSFTAADREGSLPVALVNEAFAKRAWPKPGEDPIGRRIGLGDHPFATVVGIVGDVHHRGLDVRGGSQVYVPAAQWPDNGVVLVARFAGDPLASLPAVRAAIRSVDPDQPITRVSTLGHVVAEAAGTRQFAMTLLAGFAVLATLLAAVGIYGVVSAYVSRRTREIGIRIALGATRGSILSFVAGRAVARTLAGLVVGIAGALAGGRAIRGLLFEIAPTDAAALAAGVAGVLAVAAAASVLPTRRALATDPVVALRQE
jgi:putative ABC transport system permease protein